MGKPVSRITRMDRIIAAFSPALAVKRVRARAQFSAFAGGYEGARRGRGNLSGWNPTRGDADADILADLPTLRARAADLVRNNPVAKAASDTKVTKVVGTGLKLNSAIDREFLGLSDDEADEFEGNAEREFRMWGDNLACDIKRELLFSAHQDLAFRSTLDAGDHLVLQTRHRVPGAIYRTALQHIEADRLCNKDNTRDTERHVAGVRKSAPGAPVGYDVLNTHPGNRLSRGATWTTLPAFGADGRRITLHLYRKLRDSQTRGVPDLAPVIQTIKQLGRYSDAEVDAAVKNAMWALVLKTKTGDGMGMAGLDYSEWKGSRREYYSENKIDLEGGQSHIVGLFPDDEMTSFDPNRPNNAMDPFMNVMFAQIGMALEIPMEVLTKRFQSSYSAARAAMLEMVAFVMGRREWLADYFCTPIYGTVLAEAVSMGRLNAPGFFADPAVRAAYSGCTWIGDAPGHIDENKAVTAAADRVANHLSTLKRETAALTGQDWDKVRRQREKELRHVGETAQQPAAQPSAEDLDQEDQQGATHG